LFLDNLLSFTFFTFILFLLFVVLCLFFTFSVLMTRYFCNLCGSERKFKQFKYKHGFVFCGNCFHKSKALLSEKSRLNLGRLLLDRMKDRIGEKPLQQGLLALSFLQSRMPEPMEVDFVDNGADVDNATTAVSLSVAPAVIDASNHEDDSQHSKGGGYDYDDYGGGGGGDGGDGEENKRNDEESGDDSGGIEGNRDDAFDDDDAGGTGDGGDDGSGDDSDQLGLEVDQNEQTVGHPVKRQICHE